MNPQVNTGTLSAMLRLPKFNPLTPASPSYLYPPLLPGGFADTAHMIPREGFRHLRGFLVSDQPFQIAIIFYSDSGAGFTLRWYASQVNPASLFSEVLFDDVTLLGKDFMVYAVLGGILPMVMFDYHLELVP